MGVPRDIENAIKSALAMAGINPIRGREYVPGDALAVVLDVADSYLNEYEVVKVVTYPTAKERL
jgi:hypothetical protein